MLFLLINPSFQNYFSHFTTKFLVGFGIFCVIKLSRFCWREQGLKLVQQKSPLEEDPLLPRKKKSPRWGRNLPDIFLKAPLSWEEEKRNDFDDWEVEVQIFWEKFLLWPISFLLVTYITKFSSKLTLDLFHGSFLYCSLVFNLEISCYIKFHKHCCHFLNQL